MILILLHDDTWYLLNVYVQSIGYYLQNIIQLGFHTGKSLVQLGQRCFDSTGLSNGLFASLNKIWQIPLTNRNTGTPCFVVLNNVHVKIVVWNVV